MYHAMALYFADQHISKTISQDYISRSDFASIHIHPGTQHLCCKTIYFHYGYLNCTPSTIPNQTMPTA